MASPVDGEALEGSHYGTVYGNGDSRCVIFIFIFIFTARCENKNETEAPKTNENPKTPRSPRTSKTNIIQKQNKQIKFDAVRTLKEKGHQIIFFEKT